MCRRRTRYLYFGCLTKKQEGGESFAFCKMKSRENYLETLMTFASGDQLRVACENIIYLKSGLIPEF